MNPSNLDPVELTQEFIRFDSTTPSDNGLQKKIAFYLEQIGFTVHHLPFGKVHNLYARIGTVGPLFCFAGHSDVVPSGPPDQWAVPPFSGMIRDRILYGRGAADMKGAIASMICAVPAILRSGVLKRGSISFLITGDEEGPAVDGTVKVVEWLRKKEERIVFCLVGEPTSADVIGDTIKHGRRGSINGKLTLFGIQGHVAYPQLARNPLHESLAILEELVRISFDRGNEAFEPTHLALTNMHGGTGTDNVTPDSLEVRFNIRHGNISSYSEIRKTIEDLLNRSGVKYLLEIRQAAAPFLTGKGKLIDTLTRSVRELTGVTPHLSTTGGTSDARFIAPEGIEVAELGLKNKSIHKIDESVPIDDLYSLAGLYTRVVQELLS